MKMTNSKIELLHKQSKFYFDFSTKIIEKYILIEY